MSDLLISAVANGVARVRTVDPFDTLEIYRIDRESWQATPGVAGVYLLHGVTPDSRLTVYIGMSTTNMRNRIRGHHVDKRKNWFGVLFAVPVANPLLCQAIEAELIGDLIEADVVEVIANEALEARNRGTDDVHVMPAVEKIKKGLQLVLGSDIFTPQDDSEFVTADPPVRRMTPLAREYRGQAAEVRPTTPEDPNDATHAWVGGGVRAWGRFEGDEPDKRFRVLAGSEWRRPVLNPEHVTYRRQLRVDELDHELEERGVLDAETMTFAEDHVFENWAFAVMVVGGKAQYSGGYHWQRLGP